MENNLELSLQSNFKKQKRSLFINLLFTIVPFAFGIVWMILSYQKVGAYQLEVDELQRKINSLNSHKNSLTKEYESLQHEYNSLEGDYLEAKGFHQSRNTSLFYQSIKANKLLNQLLNTEKIHPYLKIDYYKKSLDQQKVWIALQEIGYKNIREVMPHKTELLHLETNSLYYDDVNIPVIDLKIIALTLVRAGFKIQHIGPSEYSHERNLLQIITNVPRKIIKGKWVALPDPTRPITVEEISAWNNNGKAIDVKYHN
jgi:FtsZ-binding cell division protein ZapB